MKKKSTKTTAENLEQRFDDGEDVLDYFDVSSARHPDFEVQRINVDFPKWIIKGLDRESRRLGITRQALVKVWVADALGKHTPAA